MLPYGTAGVLHQLFHAAYVVKMAMGEQNGFHSQILCLEEFPQLGKILAGIDDGADLGSFFMNDKAVGLQRAQGERVDLDHSQFLRGSFIS
jgi:hypothetical protein